MEKIQKAGQHTPLGIYLNVSGTQLNITSFALKTILYEDLFSNVMTGYIVMDDAGGLIENITGYETITLGFSTPGTETTIEGTFYITSITDRVMEESGQAYVIHIMSSEGFLDNTIGLSKKFQGKPSDIIQEVFLRYLGIKKNLIVIGGDKDQNSVSVVSPYWSPLKLINWLAQRSYQGAPNKLFFEGNKFFYLASIEDLVRQPISAKYIYSPISTKKYSILKTYGVIKDMAPIDFFDIIEAQDNGYFGNTLLTHDITKKKCDTKYYNYLADYRNYKHLEKKFGDIYMSTFAALDSFRRVKTEQSSMFAENYSANYRNWMPQRNSLLYEASNLRLKINVPGSTTIEVGQVVDCFIAKATAKSPDVDLADIQDTYLSGRYLITSICHSFMLNQHDMTLEIMKDSYTATV